jgi:2-desacetyl-2-hydroxyethyl bacteriochlorophyllide A dehydrogenase
LSFAEGRAAPSPRPADGSVAVNRGATGIWFPGPRSVELRTETLADPGEGEILVRALASAISAGTEMLVYRGEVDPALPMDLPTLRGSFAFPISYGYASVGRVEEIGPEVSSVRAGDLVFVHHPHHSAYVVAASLALKLPRALDPELGVFLANVETAVNVTWDAVPRVGDRAVVFGLGVVGILVAQLMRRAGAGLVIGVDPATGRRALAEAAGMQAVIPAQGAVEAIRKLTDGLGADLVVEASGNPAALQQAIDSAAQEGTVVACSWYGRKPVQLELGEAFHRRRLRLRSSQVSSIDPGLQPRWTVERRKRLARDLLGELALKPLITHRFAPAQAAQAYALLDQGAQEAGQVIFSYG